MRIAIWFAPAPHDPWWRFGARWLGRDPRGGPAPPPWPALGWDMHRRLHWAVDPRRYGFHATLLAPFRPAPGCSFDDVAQAADAFATAHAPIRRIELSPTEHDGFAALRPVGATPAIDALAAAALRHFDSLRAAPTPVDRARQQADRMTPRERALFERWGYAKVEERFRFHMTLSDTRPPDELAATIAAAHLVLSYERLAMIDLDAVALFVEDADQADFRFVQRHLLRG